MAIVSEVRGDLTGESFLLLWIGTCGLRNRLARFMTLLYFAQSLFLVFASVYIAKESIETVLLGEGAHSHGGGGHGHGGEREHGHDHEGEAEERYV